ncbi:hypothetical protein BDK51DRAFT_25894 [Blyttiomyces helicus]|uniref:Uncharacterized protein n=1 Tax=Blyttiomyces helicus TaxID=388810 RepID=A0A4P9W6G2_9FUNG|nr:hypothetical protein BDK51DRAFT_25894 [Blyttiomyces helicus]|eukprot:RKO86953.1 hypothetical protein BDK51DRAFT_25894 [Blyttiomyces helicus]
MSVFLCLLFRQRQSGSSTCRPAKKWPSTGTEWWINPYKPLRRLIGMVTEWEIGHWEISISKRMWGRSGTGTDKEIGHWKPMREPAAEETNRETSHRDPIRRRSGPGTYRVMRCFDVGSGEGDQKFNQNCRVCLNYGLGIRNPALVAIIIVLPCAPHTPSLPSSANRIQRDLGRTESKLDRQAIGEKMCPYKLVTPNSSTGREAGRSVMLNWSNIRQAGRIEPDRSNGRVSGKIILNHSNGWDSGTVALDQSNGWEAGRIAQNWSSGGITLPWSDGKEAARRIAPNESKEANWSNRAKARRIKPRSSHGGDARTITLNQRDNKEAGIIRMIVMVYGICHPLSCYPDNPNEGIILDEGHKLAAMAQFREHYLDSHATKKISHKVHVLWFETNPLRSECMVISTEWNSRHGLESLYLFTAEVDLIDSRWDCFYPKRMHPANKWGPDGWHQSLFQVSTFWGLISDFGMRRKSGKDHNVELEEYLKYEGPTVANTLNFKGTTHHVLYLLDVSTQDPTFVVMLAKGFCNGSVWISKEEKLDTHWTQEKFGADPERGQDVGGRSQNTLQIDQSHTCAGGSRQGRRRGETRRSRHQVAKEAESAKGAKVSDKTKRAEAAKVLKEAEEAGRKDAEHLEDKQTKSFNDVTAVDKPAELSSVHSPRTGKVSKSVAILVDSDGKADPPDPYDAKKEPKGDLPVDVQWDVSIDSTSTIKANKSADAIAA